MPQAGGPAVTIAERQRVPTAIPVDNTSVYWATAEDGLLHKAPK